LGDDAFPEEVSHFIIAGLSNNPFVKRLMNTINSVGMIQRILGD